MADTSWDEAFGTTHVAPATQPVAVKDDDWEGALGQAPVIPPDAEPAPSYTETRAAEAAGVRSGQIEAFKQELVDAGSAVPEAGRRVYQKFEQVRVAKLETEGLIPKGSSRDYADYISAKEYVFANKKGGNADNWAKWMSVAGDVAVAELGLAPLRATRSAGEVVSYMRSLGRMSGEGAVAAIASSPSVKDAEDAMDVVLAKTWAGALGGTIPPAITAVGGPVASTAANMVQTARGANRGADIGGAYAAARNWIVNRIKTTMTNPNTRAILAPGTYSGRLARQMDESGTPLPISAETGSPLMARIETNIIATEAQNYANKLFLNWFEKAGVMASAARNAYKRRYGTAAPSPQALSADQLTYDVHNAFMADLSRAQRAQSAAYARESADVINIARQDRDAYPISTMLLSQKVRDYFDKPTGAIGHVLNPDQRKLSPFLSEVYDVLANPALRNPQMSVEGMVQFTRALNKLDDSYYTARSANPDVSDMLNAVHREVSSLRRAVAQDTDRAIGQMPPNSYALAAIQKYRALNADYAGFMDSREQLLRGTVSQMFGPRYAASGDPEAALIELGKREVPQQRQIVDILQRQDPEALDRMRLFYMDRALQAGYNQGGAAYTGTISPERVRAFIMQDPRGIGHAILSPAMRRRMVETANLARVFQNMPVTPTGRIGMGSDRAVSLESAAMALVSASKAFLARQAFRGTAVGTIEHSLYSEEGLRAMRVMHSTWNNPTSATVRAATYILQAGGVFPNQGSQDPDRVPSLPEVEVLGRAQ